MGEIDEPFCWRLIFQNHIKNTIHFGFSPNKQKTAQSFKHKIGTSDVWTSIFLSKWDQITGEWIFIFIEETPAKE